MSHAILPPALRFFEQADNKLAGDSYTTWCQTGLCAARGEICGILMKIAEKEGSSGDANDFWLLAN
ncbi:MAG: hypothetical protein JJ979_27170 [Roseibium sp.]|nr:hypothetical protein [Roseibium sp.]